jgi:hypothetical protein
MNFLNNIDWRNHDGVNIGMINDFMRNQFYDRVLANEVKDCECTDVGFGTGLLSMIALKHGARHIRAFESDYDRYLLGKEIIQRLGLENKVSLFNERYTHNHEPTPVTFTETVNGNLWWEGLWSSLPKANETKFLPGEYFLEIWAVTVPDSFAKGLCRRGSSGEYFSPGIDLDDTFISTINQLANWKSSSIEVELKPGIVQFERQQETDWGWIPYMRASQAGSLVAEYSASNYDKDRSCYSLSVSTAHWNNQTILIVPRAGMKHHNYKLYLDTGHWGPTESPVLLHRPQGQLIIKHNVKDGTVSYTLDQA